MDLIGFLDALRSTTEGSTNNVDTDVYEYSNKDTILYALGGILLYFIVSGYVIAFYF